MDGESQNAQDARVEELWRTLDTAKQGYLDFNGLKRGLRKIDHPLQKANGMLRDVFNAVDSNGDGRIQYSEFRSFVEHTEKELGRLFKKLDVNRNGELDRAELRTAFKNAGLTVSTSKFEQFFSEIDTNHDGSITFDEWRNFLLFIPAQTPNLRAILSYYSSTVSVSAEGDVNVADASKEGLGIASFFSTFFGTVIVLAQSVIKPSVTSQSTRSRSLNTAQQLSTSSYPPSSSTFSSTASLQTSSSSIPATFPWDPGEYTAQVDMSNSNNQTNVRDEKKKTNWLTSMLPEPGYFIAGGIAGVISRTATAPLDRLKVYLIAQTSIKKATAKAVKSGAPIEATKRIAGSLREAALALWSMGGVRSLFAGNGLNVFKVMPESAIKFGSYEAARRTMAQFEGHGDPRALSGPSQFFAAGIGGLISQFAIYPLDTLKFRMQCETVRGGLHGNALILATARKMSNKGITAFYRGLGMGLIGMFPYSAIDLTTYEYLKRYLTARNARMHSLAPEDAAPGKLMTGAIGAFSSSLGATAVYPLNLLRTRLQSQGTAIHKPVYKGWRECMQKTVKGEGVAGLYKGLTPNLLKVVPAMSISYVVYEYSKKVLGLH